MSDSQSHDSPPPRTTGGNWRWEPPSPEELEAMLSGYSVEKLLGRGGMGAVYKGVQNNLDRPVAIKILPGEIEKEDSTYDERFRNEARVMARLQHPAVVAVFDFGETPDGQLYFVMEYVDGADIAEMLSSQGKLPAEHALAITAHVCDALTAAHDLGIVHRDIKPSNVLINQQGQVKVADFGLAKLDEPDQRGLTQTGMALGTPDYVAPEALVLGVNVDARADLYAVGVMLYQMLTGELPRGAWKAPSEKVPGLDPRFDDIVNRAMQGDPADRYPSAHDLRKELDVILTVPLIKMDRPQTAALPQQAVARLPRQRSAAAPRGRRSSAKPSRSQPSGKKTALLTVGIGAAALLVAGAFYFGGAAKEAPEETLPMPVTSTFLPVTPPKPAEETETEPEPPEASPNPVAETPPKAVESETPEPGLAADPPAEEAPKPAPPTVAETKPAIEDPAPVESMPPVAAEPADPVSNPDSAPGPDVETIPGLKTRLEGYLNARREQVGALAAGYLRGLESRLDRAADDGDLPHVTAYRDEKQRVETLQEALATPPTNLLAAVAEPATLPELPGDAPEGASALRNTWQTEREKIRIDLDDKLGQSLQALEKQLTKGREFEKAEEVLAFRESIRKDAPSPVAAPPEPAPAPVAAPATAASMTVTDPVLERATKDEPFVNSLGMKFVLVPDTEILMCIHETRYKDFAEFVDDSDTGDMQPSWKDQTIDGFKITTEPDEHPVMHISVTRAREFCAWLSRKEGLPYRLPTDREWSVAVGIGKDEKWTDETTPETINRVSGFPWGDEWPPRRMSGNFSDESRKEHDPGESFNYIDGYDDGFPTTAPVMSFKPNRIGLHDMGGNVSEWVADFYNASKKYGVHRGGSWAAGDRQRLASSNRSINGPLSHESGNGFRVVLEKTASVNPQPTVVATLPNQTPANVTSTLKLPQWLEKAAEKGGKLRLWGTFDGKPIDEKEALKELRERDYIEVATGSGGLILGVQRRGRGKSIYLDPSAPFFKLRNFKEVHAVDRSHGAWLADGHYFDSGNIYRDLDLGGDAIFAGGGNGNLIRLASGEWMVRGAHWTPPLADEKAQDGLRKVCSELTNDAAVAVAAKDSSRILWITKDNLLRDFLVKSNPGSVEEMPVSSQPDEPIVELVSSGSSFGNWIARGLSGAIYVQRMGGFEAPVTDLSPAMAIRSSYGGTNKEALAVQKPDGTWQAIGPDSELNDFISSIGPAIDLDVSAYGEKQKIVLWIEPDTSLLPNVALLDPIEVAAADDKKNDKERPLVGFWTKVNTGTEFEFRSDGTVSVPLANDARYRSGKWKLRRDTMTLTFPDEEKDFTLEDGRLVGSGWELEKTR